MKNEDFHSAQHAKAHGDVSHGQSHSGSRNSYLIGFVLSAILTIIPFWLIMYNVVTGMNAAVAIAVFASAQIFVQVYFFLHVDFSPEQRNTLYSFLFTVFVVAIVMIGSLWIMHNANENMMPNMDMPMSRDGSGHVDRELEGFEDKLGVDEKQAPVHGDGSTMPGMQQ